jgi:hypothetical protein
VRKGYRGLSRQLDGERAGFSNAAAGMMLLELAG